MSHAPEDLLHLYVRADSPSPGGAPAPDSSWQPPALEGARTAESLTLGADEAPALGVTDVDA